MIEEQLPPIEYYEVLTEDGVEQSVRTTDGKSIPLAEGNRDYQMFTKVDTSLKLCKRTELMTTEVKWSEIRGKRDQLLSKSDWLILPDSPLDDVSINEWKLYRKELRDLPQLYSNPDDVIFPNEPWGNKC